MKSTSSAATLQEKSVLTGPRLLVGRTDSDSLPKPPALPVVTDYFTFHSRIPPENSGWSSTISRICLAVTGLNFALLNRSSSVP